VKKNTQIKIMVFGTFDGLHKGHLNFFKQARKLVTEPFLIVSVARDRNVFRVKEKNPALDEKKRVCLVKKSKLVDKVVLAGLRNHIPHIIKEAPSVIALGYDQKTYPKKEKSHTRVASNKLPKINLQQNNPYIKNLKKDLSKRGLKVKIVRLKPFKEKIYKSKLLYISKSKTDK